MNTYSNEPVQPVDGEQPTERVAPAEPVERVQPVQPVEPVQPARPVAYRRDVADGYGVSPAVRIAQVVYVIFGIISVLLILRVILKALAANAGAGFSRFVYGITGPLVAPFQGIFATPQTRNGSVFEFSSLVAIVVYALIGWALVRLIETLGLRRTPTTDY
jgi:uncharacterized protein YggT (Ycf19 family)